MAFLNPSALRSHADLTRLEAEMPLDQRLPNSARQAAPAVEQALAGCLFEVLVTVS